MYQKKAHAQHQWHKHFQISLTKYMVLLYKIISHSHHLPLIQRQEIPISSLKDAPWEIFRNSSLFHSEINKYLHTVNNKENQGKQRKTHSYLSSTPHLWFTACYFCSVQSIKFRSAFPTHLPSVNSPVWKWNITERDFKLEYFFPQGTNKILLRATFKQHLKPAHPVQRTPLKSGNQTVLKGFWVTTAA